MRDLIENTRALLGVNITPTQVAAFEKYEQLLLDWNERINLTAINNPEEIRSKHFLDSLTCLKVMRDTAMDRIIDVGTGAGFPGIPIKILYPGIQLTLVDSVGKKTDFCRFLVQELRLDRVQILQERAEALGQQSLHREQYDWALARAVANLPVLLEYLLPLVRVNGHVLAMKGITAPAEAHRADHAASLLGGHLRRLLPVTLPGVADERYLVVFDKIAATPHKYPRRVGLPAKKPL